MLTVVALANIRWHDFTMGRMIALAAVAFAVMPARTEAVAPLHDATKLNIGVNCQWQQSCERRQTKAMKDARRYIAKARPPVWRIHLCNKNARRGLARIDWIGFNHCIRNAKLRQPSRRR